MHSPNNQIKSPDDEEEEQTEDVDSSIIKALATKEAGQPTFLSYYSHHFGQAQDFRQRSLVAQNEKYCPEKLMQEGFSFASPKKRKAEVMDVHGEAGVRPSGRKDKHSKVRTASGPRDRRVRLSPRTAIQFYDVQDRLGYDRPSKAIDWLIKEAKTAIDALGEQTKAAENHDPPVSRHGGLLVFNGEDPVSAFGSAAQPPPTEFHAYLDQDYHLGFCSSATNWEMARLQKMSSWNYGNENPGNAIGAVGGGGGAPEFSSVNSPPLHSPAQPISGGSHMFYQREPLQSSYVKYSPINTDLPGFNFGNELSDITASATMMKNDERDKKLVFSRPPSTAPFLHYED